MLAQALLLPIGPLPVDGTPVRLGVPVARTELAHGLSLAGRGILQWRRLPFAADGDVVWIELAIVAPRGRVRVVRGGAGPCPDRRGPAYVCEVDERRVDWGVQRRTVWRWVDGTIDERERTTFSVETVLAGECYRVGEGRTRTSPELAQRAAPWWRGRDRWARQVGLLPPRAGGGSTARRVRRHLAEVCDRLVEMQSARGRGDFRRSGGVVTNNEYDTTFALLRTAVGMRHARAFRLALRSAGQLRDRDLDLRTGLPFVHGSTHRSGIPEPGHVWLRGAMWVGLITADDELLTAVHALARALATQLPRGTGRNDRLRAHAWPLAELEAVLAQHRDPLLVRAADRLAGSLLLRFDDRTGTFRFGEGRRERGYFERGWLTAGLLLPALERHLDRRPDAALRRCVEAARAAVRARIGGGGGGLPTHWRVGRAGTFAEHREFASARATWLLESLDVRTLRRLLGRSGVRRAVDATPPFDDPDLPTSFTMVARLDWVWR